MSGLGFGCPASVGARHAAADLADGRHLRRSGHGVPRPIAGGAVAVDTGLLLAVLVPPVILVSLAWLAYIFRLLFRDPPEEPPPRKR